MVHTYIRATAHQRKKLLLRFFLWFWLDDSKYDYMGVDENTLDGWLV